MKYKAGDRLKGLVDNSLVEILEVFEKDAEMFYRYRVIRAEQDRYIEREEVHSCFTFDKFLYKKIN